MRPVSGVAVCQAHGGVSIYFSPCLSGGRAGTWGRKDSQNRDVLGGVGGPWHKRMLVPESPENWGL